MGCYIDNSSRDLEYALYFEQRVVNSGRPKYEGFGVTRCVGACAAMGYMYPGKFIGYLKKLKCKKTAFIPNITNAIKKVSLAS